VSRSLKYFAAAGFVAILGLPVILQLHAQVSSKSAVVSDWIWLAGEVRPNQTVYFRKEITLKHRITSAKLHATCDNRMTVYINGKEAIASDSWESPIFRDVTDLLKAPAAGKGQEPVKNVIAVKAQNTDGPAGLVLRLVLEAPKKQATTIGTDGSWRATDKNATGWNEVKHDDASWAPAAVVAKLGRGPWKITETALVGAGKFTKPTATPIELIKVKKDFKVELLYSVPK
jgi:hypothetical protein